MSDATGHIELERAVDSISIGVRHRTNPEEDLAPLMRSIERLGLLQPVTITPDGVLICGQRRLEAVKRLGWRSLRVWVRVGLSDDLTRLLAEQDENAMHKPLSPLDAAALYRELKGLLTEDAARRQRATRFGAGDAEGPAGGPDSGPPQVGLGKTGRQAAMHVTQTASHTRLEQICEMEQIAADRDQPAVVRKVAESELDQIRQGGAVDPSYQRVKAALRVAAIQTPDDAPDDLETLAEAALARAKEDRARRIRENRLKRAAAAERARRSVRSFVLMWADLQGWTEHYDAVEVGQQLSEADWVMFERIVQETCAFADSARSERGLKSA
jgi:ParB family chromosome partitioning protein